MARPKILPFGAKDETQVKAIAAWILLEAPPPKDVPVTDDTYLFSLKIRAKAGLISATMEQQLWHYLFGKVVEKAEVEVKDPTGLRKLSREELVARTEEVLARIKAKQPQEVE